MAQVVWNAIAMLYCSKYENKRQKHIGHDK